MRRFLALLLLTILGLQSAVAIAARYCAHETEQSASAHFGHHEHQHPAQPSSDPESPQKDAHLDCAFCQLSAAQCLQGQALDGLPGSVSCALTEPPSARSPLPLDRLNRPPRARAA